MSHRFKVGEIVRIIEDGGAPSSFKKGELVEIVRLISTGNYKVKLNGRTVLFSPMDYRFEPASECHSCIYDCKLEKKCPLFEESK